MLLCGVSLKVKAAVTQLPNGVQLSTVKLTRYIIKVFLRILILCLLLLVQSAFMSIISPWKKLREATGNRIK